MQSRVLWIVSDQKSLTAKRWVIMNPTRIVVNKAQIKVITTYFKMVNPSLEKIKWNFSFEMLLKILFALFEFLSINVIPFSPGSFNVLGFPWIFFYFHSQISNMNHDSIISLIEIRLLPNAFIKIFGRKDFL